jgi:aminoglycoside 6'-N-acetyltransferase I
VITRVASTVVEEIRTFSPKDLDACAQIMVMVNNRDPWHEHWTLETAKARLWEIANTPGFVGLVCWINGIAGYALGCCEQWDTYKNFCLYEIAVIPDAQRQGIGKSLLSHLEKILASKDVHKIYLSTLRGSNAEVFYTKQGYRESKSTMTMIRYLD